MVGKGQCKHNVRVGPRGPWTTGTCTTTSVATLDLWPTWSNQWTNQWATSATASTTGYLLTTQTWQGWVEQQTHARRVIQQPSTEAVAAQAKLYAEQQRLYQEQIRQAALLALQAEESAERLLQSALTQEQRIELRDHKYFHCRSRSGRLYRINRGTHGNVKVINDQGREIESLCVQPAGVPVPDSMLAQKLHIEHCEDDFRRTANIRQLN